MSDEIRLELDNDLRCAPVDMTRLVAIAFSVSRTEAGRLIKAGAVSVIEAVDGKVDLEKRAELTEYLMVYSKKIETYLRCGKRWKKVSFSA